MRSVIRLLQLNVALSAVLVVSGSPAFPHSVLSLETSASPVCASPAVAARAEARFFRSTAAISLPPLGEVSASIGPEGGAIATPDGLIDIKVPAGAVNEPVSLTLVGRSVDPARTTYTAYEFSLTATREKDGSTLDQFDAPLTYTLSPPPGSIDPALLPSFSLLWFNPAGNYWYAVDSKADLLTGSLTAATPEVGRFELASDPLLAAGPNEGVVYPDEGGVVKSGDGQVEVTFSPGDTAERLQVSITAREGCDQHPSAKHIVSEFELNAVSIDRADAPVSAFGQPVQLSVQHPFDQVGPLEPTSLGLFQLDESTGSWTEVPAQIDPSRGTFAADLTHFSIYSTQGEQKAVLPPDIQYFQTDMHSGAARASIPLDLPPGPGGFAPALNLTYSSSSVDEMKTSRTMGSWAGVGWNLSVPMVVKDPIKGRYFLSMNGVFDLLVREDALLREDPPGQFWYRFHTKRETNLYIQGHICGSSAPDVYYEFSVRTKDGTEYQFGNQAGQWNCNGTDAQNFFRAYQAETGWHSYPYRMSLTQITDAFGNRANFTYFEDIRSDCYPAVQPPDFVCYNRTTYDQAAYPAVIQWGANGLSGHVYEVVFNQADFNNPIAHGIGGWDDEYSAYVWQPGKVRFDSPVSLAGLGCNTPAVMEIRSLTDVLVRRLSNGTTIREYVPQYDKSDGRYDCIASGNLKLTGWAEKGTSGGVLRTMSFVYENHAVQWENATPTGACGDATSNPNYYAKPRPYLNNFKNGFGGEITFTYERQWKDISGGCGWSRWVTNVRTVKPGQGQPDQVYDYDYPSNPQYPVYATPSGLANVMDAEFRGFPTVTLNLLLADKLECSFWTNDDDYLVGNMKSCSWYDDGSLSATRTVSNYYGVTDSCVAACSGWEPGWAYFTQSKFPRLERSDERLAGRQDKGTSYLYDAYGNVTDTCEYSNQFAPATPCAAGYDRRSVGAFAANTTKYIVGLPYQTWVKNGSDVDVASTAYFYDETDNPDTANPNQPPEVPQVTAERVFSDAGWITAHRYDYDSYGNLLSDRDALNNETSTTYTCSNTLPYQVTAGGLTTTYAYGDCLLGLPTTITGPDGVARNIQYDQYGRPEKDWLPGDSAGSPTTAYTYDWDATLPNGTRVDRRSESANTIWEVSCVDGFGRPVQTRQEMASPDASVVDIAYDAAGNKGSESAPYANSSGATCAAAVVGKPKSAYTYDVLGRPRTVTNADSTSRQIDYSGTTTALTNERGHKTANDVDGFGRTTNVKEYDGTTTLKASTAYGYDALDRLTTLLDAAGNSTFIFYDKAGWKKELRDPDSGTWQYTYYNNGLLKTQTDARGIKVEMTYDTLGRIKTKTYTNVPGGSSAAPTVTYTYDTCQISCPNASANGRLTMVQEWAETQKFHYDSRGRVDVERHEVTGLTLDVTRAYDSLDRVTSTTYPDGEAVANTYDAQGRIDTVMGTSNYLLTATSHNAAGLPDALALGNTKSISFTYWGDWRLKTLKTTPGTAHVDYTYEYDGVGNVTKVTDGTLTSGNIGTYSYDYADRLTDVNGLPDVIHYDYDVIGNMTKKTESPVTPNYTAADGLGGPGMFYGAGSPGPHAVTSATSWVSDVSRAHTYEYDATGNMIREKMDGRVVHEFQYDAAGHVFFRRSEPFETNGYDYYYNNSDGTLVRRVKVGATAEDVVYVGALYEKHTVNGVSTDTKYYYADGRRIAMRTGSTLYFLATDHLGGAAVVMNSAGNQVNRVRYYPFGSIRTQEGGTPVTDRLFTGQRRMSENGIYHYGARFYNAMTGRFLQADAIVPGPGNPQALNRYSYVLNNPMRYTDPSGNCPAGDDGGCDWSLAGGTPRCYSCGGTTATPLSMEDIGGIADVLEGYNFAQAMYASYCVDLYACNPYGGAVEDSLMGIGLTFEYFQLLGAVGRAIGLPRLSQSSIRSIGEVVDTAKTLENAATTAANKAGPGQGPVHGTRIHTLFKEEVRALGNPSLQAEKSFINGRQMPYGTRGSIRPDAVLFDESGRVIAAFELKTGSAALTTQRVLQIQRQLGPIPVIEIRPKP